MKLRKSVRINQRNALSLSSAPSSMVTLLKLNKEKTCLALTYTYVYYRYMCLCVWDIWGIQGRLVPLVSRLTKPCSGLFPPLGSACHLALTYGSKKL